MEKYLMIEVVYWLFWPSIFCFGLKLFRFQIKIFLPQITLATLLLSQVSYLLQMTHLIYLMSIIQFIAGWICFWVILRIPLQYSLLMMIFSFIVLTITEDTTNLLLPKSLITFINEHNLLQFLWSSVLICTLQFLYTWILHRTRFGFSFIPQSRIPRQINYIGGALTKLTISLYFVAFLASSLCVFLYPAAIAALSVLLLIGLAILLRKSFRWELGE